MTDETQRHERYKTYALYAYNLEKAHFPHGVLVEGIGINPITGFYGYAIKKNNQIVIVYKGTDSKKEDKLIGYKDIMHDYITDFRMSLLKKIPTQFQDALQLFDKIKQQYPNAHISLVGHSLGGSLAQYVAIMRNVDEAVCFAPVGIGTNVNDFLEKYGSKTPINRIINYNNPKDDLTNRFRNRLYGANYIIDAINPKGSKHELENMKPLYTRKKANPSYSPTKKGCAGTYHVNGYKRADGTEVSDYYRTCGARHKSLDGVDIRFATENLSNDEIKAGRAKYAGKRYQDLTRAEQFDAIKYFV